MGIHNVGNQVIEGTRLYFCNGVDNSIEDAEESAKLISRIFNNQQVTVCYNPMTLLLHVAGSKWGGLKESAKEVIKLNEQTSTELAKHINREIKKCARVLIHIFSHSAGIKVVGQALRKLKSVENVHVHAFGAPDLIKNKAARSVMHYVNEHDIVAMFGNWIDHNSAIHTLRNIHEKTGKEKPTRKELLVAARALANREANSEMLIDAIQKNRSKKTKQRKYFTPAVIRQGYFSKIYGEYKSTIDSYSIQFIPENKDTGKPDGWLDAIYKVCVAGHVFSTYTPLLKEIEAQHSLGSGLGVEDISRS